MYKNVSIAILSLSFIAIFYLFLAEKHKNEDHQNEMEFLDKSYAYNSLLATYSLKHISAHTEDVTSINLAKAFILMTYSRVTKYIDTNEEKVNELSYEIVNAIIDKNEEMRFNFTDNELKKVTSFRYAAEKYKKYLSKIP